MAYNIVTHFENCSYDAYYDEIGLATSKLIFVITSTNFATMQSSKEKIKELRTAILSELSKFKWIIYGDVNLDFTWYFSSIRKKETDAIGDLDNLMKPIIDSFTGMNGLFIDDSQIGSIHELWMSKDITESEDTVLRVEINFNNDDCVIKTNVKFVELEKGKYALYCFDDSDKDELMNTLIQWHVEKKFRRFMDDIIAKEPNLGLYKTSFNVFHTSRLNGVDKSLKYDTTRFKSKCRKSGIDFKEISATYKAFLTLVYRLINKMLKDNPSENIDKQGLFFSIARQMLHFPGNIIAENSQSE